MTTSVAPPTTRVEALAATMIELAGIPSVSGHEEQVRVYVAARLAKLGLTTQVDAGGNLIARVAGFPARRDTEPPLLLNAHMDRVPPGKAHVPIRDGDLLRGDGTTNLGADDSAGIAIILHTVGTLLASKTSRPPLVLLFTTREEIGLQGAKAFDPAPWGARDGIVFDNAGEPGDIVTRAATYIAFDVTLRGVSGHPGKGFAGTVSAIEIFRRLRLKVGSVDGNLTRISLGRIEGGSARNAVPGQVHIQGEARTLLTGAAQARLMRRIAAAFTRAAQSLGGSAASEFDAHCAGFEVAETEPMLAAWRTAAESVGLPSRMVTTFIGSDASALRPHCRVLTVSTGAMEEHTAREWVALTPLGDLVAAAVAMIRRWGR
jgi:tripeptide aminopeptidase